MKMQDSSKEIKNCIKCDDFIMRSERRFTDGCLHHHLNCNDKLKCNVMDTKTYKVKKLKPELKPIDEFFIAITTTDGNTVKGWYDFNDKSYCDVNETLIEISTIVTWDKWIVTEGE